MASVRSAIEVAWLALLAKDARRLIECVVHVELARTAPASDPLGDDAAIAITVL